MQGYEAAQRNYDRHLPADLRSDEQIEADALARKEALRQMERDEALIAKAYDNYLSSINRVLAKRRK